MGASCMSNSQSDLLKTIGTIKTNTLFVLPLPYGGLQRNICNYMYVLLDINNTTWFPQIMTYLFQRLFKDFWGTFSRTFQGLFFVLSNIHSRKNDKPLTFKIRHTETIWFWFRPKNGGGGIRVWVFNFFFNDLLYYGHNTASNNSAWKGGLGVLPQKNFISISTKSFNSGGYTSLVIMKQ